MTDDELEAARAALLMINPAPYNAEAPPAALEGEITPTGLHYVRSNFAVPAHDGALEISGAVENPVTLGLDDLRALPAHERAVTLECAGNGRLEMRPLPTGEPWGDYAVSTSRWTGALLSDVLGLARPTADGVDVRFAGADHGAYHLQPILPETSKSDLTFERALPLALAADPAAEILVAYEMNGQPLGPDHGAPFRLIVPHWYAVASVKWLSRIDVLTEPFTGEFQTGHYMYQWPDRPQEPVSLMRVRARITDPGTGVDDRPRALHRQRQGVVGSGSRHPGRGQPHRRRRLAPGPARTGPGPLPVAGLGLRLGHGRHRKAHSSRPGDRRSRERPTGRATVEPARIRKQRRRGPVRRPALTAPTRHPSRVIPDRCHLPR